MCFLRRCDVNLPDLPSLLGGHSLQLKTSKGMLIGLGAAGGGMEIIISSSLSLQARAHKCISFAAGKSSDRYFPGKAACPRCAVCMSRFGQGTTNKCRALFPSSRGEDPPSPPEGFTPSSRRSAWQQRPRPGGMWHYNEVQGDPLG